MRSPKVSPQIARVIRDSQVDPFSLNKQVTEKATITEQFFNNYIDNMPYFVKEQIERSKLANVPVKSKGF